MKEDNDELQAKLRCLKDTAATLDRQLTEQAKEFRAGKLLWAQREEELAREIDTLVAENDALKAKQGQHDKELREMRKNYDTICKLHEFEETKVKRNERVIRELQARLAAEETSGKGRFKTGARMVTECDSAGGMQSAREFEAPMSEETHKGAKHLALANGKSKRTPSDKLLSKTPHVKSVATQGGMLFNPISKFFA